MAYSEDVARRVAGALAGYPGVVEKKMFGGLAFMLQGHMCCGVIGEELMVRVGPDAYEEALRLPAAREMDFTGRPLKGMVYVDPSGFEAKAELAGWVERAVEFVLSLPAK
jgi:TfoX/Sxy family transcriptional regulator of competence genes